jgi:hypothetical protein
VVLLFGTEIPWAQKMYFQIDLAWANSSSKVLVRIANHCGSRTKATNDSEEQITTDLL